MNHEKYFNTREGKVVKKFIEDPIQKVVVYAVIHKPRGYTIRCYGPVLGNLELSAYDGDIQRGDILGLTRSENGCYKVVENYTVNQIVQTGLNRIFATAGILPDQQKMIEKIISEKQK